MRLLISTIAFLATLASASGIVDISLIHPQANRTYAPTDQLPVIFAIQNPTQAEHISPSIWYRIWFRALNLNATELESYEDIGVISDSDFDFLDWVNASDTGPYLFWHYVNVSLPEESEVRVIWQPRWSECFERDDGVDLSRNHTEENFAVSFFVGKDGQKVDLIADTSDISKGCPNEGVAINVTDETLETQDDRSCPVVAKSSISSSNPCKVKIDEGALESMGAVDLKMRCKGINPPSECPEREDDAAPRFAVSSLLSLAFILGIASLI
ncbi:hypothetical protein CC79DRAFT_145946 [Sarocladium strictum]